MPAQSLSFWHAQVLGPPRHCPPPHWSPLVQLLPSSQEPLTALWKQPDLASQPSLVHGLPSSQFWL